MQYLVMCVTNYDEGYIIGGVYRNYDKAVKRLDWCERHTLNPENDSWRIVPVRAENITASLGE